MNQLAEFLRARRESLHPADVGLRDVGRRRTPGLRREEVATLAGVSIDYLVRLEQGRDLHPSAAIIAALATALQLNEDERRHLAHLALINSNTELCPEWSGLVDQVAPTVQLLVERLDATPAFVVGPLNDVLFCNRSWQQLVEPLGFLDELPPNLIRHAFTHPLARAVYPDWSWTADEQVSRLRSASPRWSQDDRFVELLAGLTEIPEFATRWANHTVSEKRRGTKRLSHPQVGELRLAYEVLELPDDGEQRLITWLAADDATADALRRVSDETSSASPPHLRVVRGA